MTKCETADVSTETPRGPGKGWHGDPEGHARAGKLGSLKRPPDPAHMAVIGRLGGLVTSADRQRMVEMGRKGGAERARRIRERKRNECQEERVSGPF